MTLPKEVSIMNDKILLAQNIKGTGKATFEGLYDNDDDPVTVVVDKNDDGVYIVIYKDIDDEDEYDDEDEDYDDIDTCNICEDCLREECSKHDNCDDCPISHCCESMFENDD